jgi:hypothetical protein
MDDTGPCSLVVKHRSDLSPGGVVSGCGLVWPRQTLDVEILETDPGETLGNAIRQRVDKAHQTNYLTLKTVPAFLAYRASPHHAGLPNCGAPNRQQNGASSVDFRRKMMAQSAVPGVRWRWARWASVPLID